jgi:hypothetical protein
MPGNRGVTGEKMFHSRNMTRLLIVLPLVALLSGCTSEKIIFIYPPEEIDFTLRDMKTPGLYIDTITDMRPLAQREGTGAFFDVNYPADEDMLNPATLVYADALALDIEQTHLVELVPLRAQADYILSIDLLSMGNNIKRSPSSFLLAAALGGGAGFVMGGSDSHGVKTGVALGLLAMVALPMPSQNVAECEVRLVLKNRQGEVVWEQACLGEVEKKAYVGMASREDQKWVDELLTKAVKRCNACLLGQMRQALLEDAGRPLE